jgi:prefoldin subunit 5
LAHEELIEWVRKRIAELEEELTKMREILSILENQKVTV